MREARGQKAEILQPLAALLIACGLAISAASACPFCTAVAPSLSQQRESADVVALGESIDPSSKPPQFRLHRILKGEGLLADKEMLAAEVDSAVKQGSLVVLFGTKTGNETDLKNEALSWSAVPVDESSAAYFLRTPSLREPEPERLKYFARFLEHPDPLIAEDAYREFGHGRFDAVAKVVDALPSDRLRAWLTSDRVPEARQGFYGLALGLIRNERENRENAAFLTKLITADQDDFRAGFDGVLGGYLLLTGDDGLDLIEKRFLANSEAKVGNVRHAMTALRFYREYGHEIAPERLRAAMAKTLARPEFAEAAITDLARWQAWEYADTIAALYRQSAFDQPEIRRAIVGYLRACPEKSAAEQLARLRAQDPQGVAAAENVLSKLGKLPQ